jgi:parallel beta-helix repeat protein
MSPSLRLDPSPRLRSRAFALPCLLALGLAGSSLGCGDSSGTGGASSTGSTTASGSTGTGNTIACPTAEVAGCTTAIAPSGADDTKALQTALIDVKSDETLCLCPGTFHVTSQLSLTVPKVTVKGAGKTREDTIIDFTGQQMGKDGFTVTADGFTVQNLWLKNSPGNGIVVTGVTGVKFSGLKVSWDAGSVVTNGAYAVYPVKSTNVILEDTEIVGAADAGAYVGQCHQAIVRNNKVHGNVAGIEIENTTDAEVYGNESWDNAAGVLVFALPNLEKKDGVRANVHDNNIHDNNRDNFAMMGSIVSNVPTGTGMLILAADETEVHDNNIHDNASTGILLVDLVSLCALASGACGTPDPMTDPDPEKTYVYNNTFTNNGTTPKAPLLLIPKVPLEDFLWDGVEKTMGSAQLCFGMGTPPSFRNIHGVTNINNLAMQTTDASAYKCDLPKQTPLSF